MKRPRAVGRAHAVHLHDDEAQLSQGRETPRGAKGFRHEGALRTGIDGLDHGVLLVRIEVSRPANDAPDIRSGVAALGHEYLRRLPTTRLKLRNVRLFKPAD